MPFPWKMQGGERIITSSKLKESLTITLHEIENWVNTNKLPVNETKTKTMLVAGKCLQDKMIPEDQGLNLH